jgi:hypothetical protein
MLLICFGSLIYAQAPGTLYGTTGASSNELIIIDPSTGAGVVVATITGTSSSITEIEFRNDEVLFGTGGGGLSEVVTLDPLTGVATIIGTHPFGAVNGMDFDSGVNLLGSHFNPGVSTDLVVIDQTTGGFASVIGPIFTAEVVTGLTFSSGGTLYGVAHLTGANQPSSLYTIDPATGTPTLVGPIGFDKVGAIEFGPDGVLYGGVGSGVANAGALISIDPSTGAGTLIGPTGFPAISGLSFFPGIVPVELTSFAASVNESEVLLSWATATELNNNGFDIERNSGNGFEAIGFVPGFGTTTEAHSYSFADSDVPADTYTYRLKQVDFDGTFEYSDEIEVEVIAPIEFALRQNYPNPFNPSTQITYQLAQSSNVVLKVYNLLGKEIAVLVDEHKEAGVYKVNFDASNLPSGVYLYKIETAGLIKTKKMMLMK